MHGVYKCRGKGILKTITNTQYVLVDGMMVGWLPVALLTLASCSRLVAEIIMHHSSSLLVKLSFKILTQSLTFHMSFVSKVIVL